MDNIDQYSLLYQLYRKEFEAILPETVMDEPEFTSMISVQLRDMPLIEEKIDDQVGFLYYREREDKMARITVPVYGYYAENEKMMVRLFRKLTEKVRQHAAIEYSVQLYSHDQTCIQAMHMMQFGNMAEKCIKKISEEEIELLPGVNIRELDKEEINCRWKEVWQAVFQIILHLTQSPVFYKGEEFTEEVYRDFFLEKSTHVIAASIDKRIVGIIEWNEERNPMISGGCDSVNVGEIFVYPEFRGSGLSQKLFQFAENQACRRGAGYMWVEHGTANPEARGFWNKYFATYQYELVRVIVR